MGHLALALALALALPLPKYTASPSSYPSPCVNIKANNVGWTPLMAATHHANGNPKILNMLHEGGIEGSGGYIEPGSRTMFT